MRWEPGRERSIGEEGALVCARCERAVRCARAARGARVDCLAAGEEGRWLELVCCVDVHAGSVGGAFPGAPPTPSPNQIGFANRLPRSERWLNARVPARLAVQARRGRWGSSVDSPVVFVDLNGRLKARP